MGEYLCNSRFDAPADGGRFFMSIGSVIRTEGRSPIADRAFYMAERKPVILAPTRPWNERR